MRIVNIDPQGETALALLGEAAADVRPLYGALPGPPWPHNKPLGCRDVYIAVIDADQPVACGALREIDETRCELCRLYVLRTHRRLGLARAMLTHLCTAATGLQYRHMWLETGNRQAAAISLYESYGFSRIEPFGEYVLDPTSICYELRIDQDIAP